MSGQVVSKNMYELLGNDPELDPDRPADPPTKAIDKPVQRHGKRDGTDAPRPVPERVGNQSRAKQTNSANENAFRDRDVGAARNRGRGSGEPVEGGHRGGQRGRGRGGRGGRGGARGNDDRHSKTGVADNEKQAAHGWGGNDGNAELEDEQAGEAIAKAEEKEANAEDAADIAEPEPEDKSKSYTAYLAELAEKKLSLGAQNVRQANEGSSKKFPEGKALDRQEEEDFFAAQAGKTKRERQRKEKVHVELDGDRMLAPPPREGGGRGRGRGRGEGRGEFRGRGEGRGDFRGGERRGGAEGRGRGRGEGGRGRGEGRGRGGRGGQSGPNITDSSAFPSLGA